MLIILISYYINTCSRTFRLFKYFHISQNATYFKKIDMVSKYLYVINVVYGIKVYIFYKKISYTIFIHRNITCSVKNNCPYLEIMRLIKI